MHCEVLELAVTSSSCLVLCCVSVEEILFIIISLIGVMVSIYEQKHLRNCFTSIYTVVPLCCVQDIVWGCVAVGMWKACGSQVGTGSEMVTSAGANAL